jgi:hypothetical protein
MYVGRKSKSNLEFALMIEENSRETPKCLSPHVPSVNLESTPQIQARYIAIEAYPCKADLPVDSPPNGY